MTPNYSSNQYRFINNFYTTGLIKEPLNKMNSKAATTILPPVTLICDLFINGAIDTVNYSLAICVSKTSVFSISYFEGTQKCLSSLGEFLIGRSLLKTATFLQNLPENKTLSTVSATAQKHLNPVAPPFTIYDPALLKQIQTDLKADGKQEKSSISDNNKRAKNNLQAALEKYKIRATVEYIKPQTWSANKVENNELDSTIFSWCNTEDIMDDFQKAAQQSSVVYLFQGASQYNATEAIKRFVPKPGEAVQNALEDYTQGARLQLCNADLFELINAYLSNDGFTMLELREWIKDSLVCGYLTPLTAQKEKIIANYLEKYWLEIEQPCITRLCKDGKTPIHYMLSAAPAFGSYVQNFEFDPDDRKKLQYFAALANYQAQLQQTLKLAQDCAPKKFIYRPTCVGVGVFGNDPLIVGEAFKTAALAFQEKLKTLNAQRQENGQPPLDIQIELAIHQRNNEALKMAQASGLLEKKIQTNVVSPVTLRACADFAQKAAPLDHPRHYMLNGTDYKMWWNKDDKAFNIQKGANFNERKQKINKLEKIGIKLEGSRTAYYVNSISWEESTLPPKEATLLADLLPLILADKQAYDFAEAAIKYFEEDCLTFILHQTIASQNHTFHDHSMEQPIVQPASITLEDVKFHYTQREEDQKVHARTKQKETFYTFHFEMLKLKKHIELEVAYRGVPEKMCPCSLKIDGKVVNDLTELYNPKMGWGKELTAFLRSNLHTNGWSIEDNNLSYFPLALHYFPETILADLCKNGKFELKSLSPMNSSDSTLTPPSIRQFLNELCKRILDGHSTRSLSVNSKKVPTLKYSHLNDPGIITLNHLGILIGACLENPEYQIGYALPENYLKLIFEVMQVYRDNTFTKVDQDFVILHSHSMLSPDEERLWNKLKANPTLDFSTRPSITDILDIERNSSYEDIFAKIPSYLNEKYHPIVWSAYLIVQCIPKSDEIAKLSFEEFRARVQEREWTPKDLVKKIRIDERVAESFSQHLETFEKIAKWLGGLIEKRDKAWCQKLVQALTGADFHDGTALTLMIHRRYESHLILIDVINKETGENFSFDAICSAVEKTLEDKVREFESAEIETKEEEIAKRETQPLPGTEMSPLINLLKAVSIIAPDYDSPIEFKDYFVWYNSDHNAVNIQSKRYFNSEEFDDAQKEKLGLSIKLPHKKISYFIDNEPGAGIPTDASWMNDVKSLIAEINSKFEDYKRVLGESEHIKNALGFLFELFKKSILKNGTKVDFYSFSMSEKEIVSQQRGGSTSKIEHHLKITNQSIALIAKFSEEGKLESLEWNGNTQKKALNVINSECKKILQEALKAFYMTKAFEPQSMYLYAHPQTLSLCPEAVLNYLCTTDTFKLNSFGFLKDDLKHDKAIDAGGPSTQLIDNLSGHLLDNSPSRVIKLDSETTFPTLRGDTISNEEKETFKQLGLFFIYCISSNPPRVMRRIFNDGFFKLIKVASKMNKATFTDSDIIAIAEKAYLSPVPEWLFDCYRKTRTIESYNRDFIEDNIGISFSSSKNELNDAIENYVLTSSSYYWIQQYIKNPWTTLSSKEKAFIKEKLEINFDIEPKNLQDPKVLANFKTVLSEFLKKNELSSADWLFKYYNKPYKLSDEDKEFISAALDIEIDNDDLLKSKKAIGDYIVSTYRGRVIPAIYIASGKGIFGSYPFKQLSVRIQGLEFDRKTIADMIRYNGVNTVICEKVVWLKEAIMTKDKEWVKSFLKTVTGSAGVNANTVININEHSAPNCTAHTCFKSLDVPNWHTDHGTDANAKATNKEKFIKNLEMTMGMNGYDMA